MSVVIGYVCAGLAVALIIYSAWAVGGGGTGGMVPLLTGFVLLLVAVGALKSNSTGLGRAL